MGCWCVGLPPGHFGYVRFLEFFGISQPGDITVVWPVLCNTGGCSALSSCGNLGSFPFHIGAAGDTMRAPTAPETSCPCQYFEVGWKEIKSVPKRTPVSLGSSVLLADPRSLLPCPAPHPSCPPGHREPVWLEVRPAMGKIGLFCFPTFLKP